MAYQINTTNYVGLGPFDGSPYSKPVENTVFKMSNGDLVTFYIKDQEKLWYSISTDDGVNWSNTVINSSSWNAVTCYQEGDDILVAKLPESMDSIQVSWFTYDIESSSFSIGTWYEVGTSHYNGGDDTASIVKYDGRYWIFPSRAGTRAYYGFYALTSDISSWTQVSTSGNDNPLVHSPVIMSDRIRIFTVQDSNLLRTSDITGTGGSYTWNTPVTLDTDVEEEPWSVNSYYISDSEIYIVYRNDSNELYSIKYNGSSYETPVKISDNYGLYHHFLEINSETYIAFREYDSGGNRSLVYKKLTETGWGDSTTIISDSTLTGFETLSESTGEIVYFYTNGASSPYSISYDTEEVLSGETINATETINVSDSVELIKSDEYINVSEDIDVSDELQSITNAIDSIETVTVSDSIELIRHAIDIEETVNIDDSLNTEINKIEIEESVSISDNQEMSNKGTVDYASKILSYNPLIVVTDTNPAKIAQIDVSNPSDPSWSIYTLSGISNANSITYNSVTNYIYAFCDSGDIVKMPISDLNDQTVIDTLDTDNLEFSDISVDEFKNFISTDDSSGEIILLDEATTKSISMDIRFLEEIKEYVSLQINTILGKTLSTDIRFLKEETTSLGLDIRFLKYNYNETSEHPIEYSDWQVLINDVDMVPLNDVDMKSINITHTVDEKSIASFRLNRKFDDLDRTHEGTSSQITNNNSVKIYIDGNLEFDGKVGDISTDSESETVILTCYADTPSDYRQTVKIPLVSLNEKINLYHCLTQNIQIENPYIDSSIYEADSVYGSGETNLYLTDPQYYKGVKYDKGTYIEQMVNRWQYLSNVADDIKNGNFSPKQNWSYFWLVSLVYLRTGDIFGKTQSITNSRYIGTSLSPITSDIIDLSTATYKYQRIYDNNETELGYGYIGEAPYLEVSGPNGKLKTKIRWEDRGDGLYVVKDEGYDNLNTIEKIAELEYDKLKNINGDILPITSCSMNLTIDAYYFYNLHLLTRVNLDNTTTEDIYNNNNGFPTSIKSITISSNDMRVNLQTDNQLSQTEIDEIDENIPTDDNIISGYDSKIHSKWDIVERKYII